MSHARKRQRTGDFVFQSSARRPIDKKIFAHLDQALDATQTNTTMLTVTFPCTITGLRWDMSAVPDAGTGVAMIRWAIVVVHDGNAAATMGQSGDFYTPEQDVLAFGTGQTTGGVDEIHWNGATKTMRKLMGGDLLVLCQVGVATNTLQTMSLVQFFCKT